VDGATNAPSILEVRSEAWGWQSGTLAVEAASHAVGALFSWDSGSVDLDSASLTAGAWVSPAPGENIDLPAACFFHAGYTERDLQSVVLRKDFEPTEGILYGPYLPLDPGRYSVELVFESPAPERTTLGRLRIGERRDQEDKGTPVVAGERALIGFETKDNRPFLVAFEFARTADVKISHVRVSRIE